MNHATAQSISTRTVRFHAFGEPADVLVFEEATLPPPQAQRIRVRVKACGVNPADWALCRGLFPGNLPRGIGLEVAGTVESLGEGVSDVAVGDEVFGPADFVGSPAAGAADYAVLSKWVRRPEGLDPIKAAALPVAIESAAMHLAFLEVGPGKTVMIHGAGTIVGFFAAQIAQRKGARVLATAGEISAKRLHKRGIPVIPYGDGLVERAKALAGGALDVILDTAPVSGVLPELVEIAGDPKRVMTISDFEGAQALGVRYSFGEQPLKDFQAPLAEYASLAASGDFEVPVSRVFSLHDWREAMAVSLSQQARGKLVLVP